MSLSPPTVLPHCFFFSGHISRSDRLEQATGKLERKLCGRLITRVWLNCSYPYELSGNYGREKPYKYKVSASRFFFQNALYLLVQQKKRLRLHHLNLYILSHKSPMTLGRDIDVENSISSIQWSDIGMLPWENFNLGSTAFQCILLSNQGKFLGIKMGPLFTHICFIYILFAFTQSSLVKKKFGRFFIPLIKKITFCKQPGLPWRLDRNFCQSSECLGNPAFYLKATNLTFITQSVCPYLVCKHCPVDMFHIRTVESAEPLTTVSWSSQ